MKYDIEWVHIRGINNRWADTLSRLEKPLMTSIRSPVGIKQVAELKEDNKRWKALRKELVLEQRLDSELKKFIQINPHLIIIEKDGLTRVSVNNKELIFVPKSMKIKVAKAIHKLLLHFGSNKMCSFIKEHMIMSNADRVCREIARSCELCQRSKYYNKRTEGRWIFKLPSNKNEIISADLLGPLPLTEKGNQYVLVMIDQFSKKICLKAIQDRKAKTIAKAAKKMIAKEYNGCKNIVTDNAKEFHSNEWKKMGLELKVNEKTTTPYNPQSSCVERFMKEIARILRAYMYYKQTKWDKIILRIEQTINSTSHSVTKTAPYDVTGEKKIIIPAKLSNDCIANKKQMEEYETSINKIYSSMQRKRDKIQSKIRPPAKKLVPGDSVLVKTNPTSEKYARRTKKLCLLYEGPYKIIKAKTRNAYVIKRNNSNSFITRNTRRLRPYIEPCDPSLSEWETQESESESENDTAETSTINSYDAVLRSISTVDSQQSVYTTVKMDKIVELASEIQGLDEKILSMMGQAKKYREQLTKLIQSDIDINKFKCALAKNNLTDMAETSLMKQTDQNHRISNFEDINENPVVQFQDYVEEVIIETDGQGNFKWPDSLDYITLPLNKSLVSENKK